MLWILPLYLHVNQNSDDDDEGCKEEITTVPFTMAEKHGGVHIHLNYGSVITFPVNPVYTVFPRI